MNDDPKLKFTYTQDMAFLGEGTVTLADGRKITGPCFVTLAPVIEPVERPIRASLHVLHTSNGRVRAARKGG